MGTIEFFETLRREGIEFWIESQREIKNYGEFKIFGKINITKNLSYASKIHDSFSDCVNWMMELMGNEYPDIFNFTNKKEGGLS